ncbi:hypothetical protein BPAE_0091g00310 [Botrytis paeoniae]|uniref:RING-type domain-containing protein n=1 Tax=Botrytis paeoniae TaxID=278948 RepID=A0A4Z1FRC6_9HELO|nr:hypothetical protein BPAE_0091g00310 [Botrytis paeoniae]
MISTAHFLTLSPWSIFMFMGISFTKMFSPQPASSKSSFLASYTDIPEVLPPQRCSICNEDIGTSHCDGEIEAAYILPCSHVFGSTCILRWLETDSPHQNCPQCRRKMVYTECGHLIRPCEVSSAPQSVREADMPKRCLGCRGLEGELKDEVEMLLKRAEVEQRALTAMKMHFPGVWGEMCRDTVRTVGKRVEESREVLRRDIEELCRKYEESGKREQW